MLRSKFCASVEQSLLSNWEFISCNDCDLVFEVRDSVVGDVDAWQFNFIPIHDANEQSGEFGGVEMIICLIMIRLG